MHNNSHKEGGFPTRFPNLFLTLFTAAMVLSGCAGPSADFGEDGMPATEVDTKAGEADANGFVWQTEQFADLKMIRYQVPGWNKLTQQQRCLAYCLT